MRNGLWERSDVQALKSANLKNEMFEPIRFGDVCYKQRIMGTLGDKYIKSANRKNEMYVVKLCLRQEE